MGYHYGLLILIIACSISSVILSSGNLNLSVERSTLSCRINDDCDDGNKCTSHYCDEGYCVYSAIACDDGNMCTNQDCDASIGCLFTSVNCSVGAACATYQCDIHSGCLVDYTGCGNRGTNDCCTESTLPFCLNDTITTCTCLIEPSCCTDAWSAQCISIAESSCPLVCDAPIEEPANDVCTAAQVLTVTGEVGQVLTYLTAETPMITLTTCFGQFTSKGLWFSFVGTGKEIVFDTCSPQTTFETTLHVFTGTCSNLTCVNFANSGEDCTAQLSFNSVANQQYYLFVGSNANDPAVTIGAVEFVYYDSSCQTNDDCIDEGDMCTTGQCLVGRCSYTEVVCPPATGPCGVVSCDPMIGCVYSNDTQCTPYKIDCCEHNLYHGGCNDTRIEQCVCAIDDRCCNESWFSICLEIASTSCQAGCFAVTTPQIATPSSVPAVTAPTSGPGASPSATISQDPQTDQNRAVIIALSVLVAVFGLLAIVGLIVIILQRRVLASKNRIAAESLLGNYN